MGEIQYRMFFNDKPAAREQLDRVEEISVEQEVDMAWQARIKIPVSVDDKGKWSGEDDPLIAPFSRMRVEVRVGDQPWVPLIDGPIVDHDGEMSAQPGQSATSVIVQDDSVYLNREDTIAVFESPAHEIAAQLFTGDDVEHIASTDIEDTPAPPITPAPSVIQRGTAIQLLRALARRHGMHAYVLPGDEPGQSVGCFKSFASEPDRPPLPPLILLGSDRNLETLNVRNEARKPSTVQAASLNLWDKSLLTGSSSFGDLELLGEERPFEEKQEKETTKQILGSYDDSWADPQQAAVAEAQRASYAFDATGSVLTECYGAVLRPYRLVSVHGADGRQSGDYLIHKVSHTITRSTYSQSFVLKRNARSPGSGAGASDLVESVF